MLSKQRRIKKSLFPEIITKGKRYNSPHFLLYVHKTEIQNPSKFCFSVSKKTASHAVLRNKYRRQGYSIISKYLDHILPGYICFFSIKKTQIPLTFDVFEKEIIFLLKEINILK